MNKNVTDTSPTPAEKHEEAVLELAIHNLLMKERDKAAEPLDETSETLLEEQYLRSLPQRMALIERETKHAHSRVKQRYGIARILKTAAVAVLCLNFALTVAVASNGTLRSYVFEFFIQTNSRSADIGFHVSDTTVDIPEGWTANCYPTYIPEGFELIQCVSIKSKNSALYTDPQDRLLSFTVYQRDTKVNIDAENAVISEIHINGVDATLFAKDTGNTLVWSYGDQFIVIYMKGTVDEIIKVADPAQ